MFARSVRSGLDQLADDCDADLLVIGASRRGTIGRLLRGTYTLRSPGPPARPVAVAPLAYAERRGPIKTIGVAYDASPASQRALAEARRLAAPMDAAVHTMTVVSEAHTDAATRRRTVINPALTGAAIRGSTSVAPALTSAAWSASSGRGRHAVLDRHEREAEDQLRSLRGVQAHLAIGSPIHELLAFTEHVDLLIIGSQSHGPLRRLIHGSTSARLAESARCPVLIVPPAGATLGATAEQ
jgi:nucleotide-binding universal stress UspA family protein